MILYISGYKEKILTVNAARYFLLFNHSDNYYYIQPKTKNVLEDNIHFLYV